MEGGVGLKVDMIRMIPHLGGSFVQDSTLVFEAKVASEQYWKIETKNTYTSKGWEQVSVNDTQTSYTPGMEMGEIEKRECGRYNPTTCRFEGVGRFSIHCLSLWDE